MTKITVLMGIYNCASTLPRALDSLLDQTYSSWKCILCDDGSIDDTYDIAKEYVNKYPDKFFLIKNEMNQGLNITLNNCLALADTEYIARMDGDDISLPTRFEKQYMFLENNKEYDLVSSAMIHFDKNGDFRISSGKQNPTNRDVVTKSPIHHAPVMIRTKAIKAVNGYSTKKSTMRVEDVDLWIKLYSNGSLCYNLSEPLYKMQDDRDATSRRKFKYRINSSITRWGGCKKLHMGIDCYIMCFTPIIVGLLPRPIYVFLHRHKKG